MTRAHLPKGFTEKRANVDGVTINYKIGGQGPVVVLLHGYAQTSHMWRPLMSFLATVHTVIAPDLRGAGGSARPPAGYEKKTLAKDIRGLVRQLGYQQVTVVADLRRGLRSSRRHACRVRSFASAGAGSRGEGRARARPGAGG